MTPRFVVAGLAASFLLCGVVSAQQPIDPASREAMMGRLTGQGPTIATAVATDEVPAGSISVLVVDVAGEPIEGSPVRVGMRAQQEREAVVGTTDASGVALFEGLATGVAMAYRITVPHEGASYGSTPFRLEANRGHRVRIVRLPTTQDLRFVLQVQGQMVVEIKNERLHIIQSADLANMSESAYVFPTDGLEFPMPEGFTAFQSAEMMTDQRIEESDRGFRVHGSLPPGRVSLRWAYDLPINDENLRFSQALPFRTHQYMVVADAAEGLTLSVDRFSAARTVVQTENRFLVTEQRFSPEEPVLESLVVSLNGIPGPGPLRWIALALALLAFLAALYSLVVPGDENSVSKQARDLRREELLEDAEEVQNLYDESEIGPSHRSRRLEEIASELAALALLDAEASAKHDSDRPRGRSGGRAR